MDQNPQQTDSKQRFEGQEAKTSTKRPIDKSDVFYLIRRMTAWVMIISAVMFALVGVLAVWEVFGDNAGDVVWRALASLGIIAFASLIVNVASRVAMRH